MTKLQQHYSQLSDIKFVFGEGKVPCSGGEELALLRQWWPDEVNDSSVSVDVTVELIEGLASECSFGSNSNDATDVVILGFSQGGCAAALLAALCTVLARNNSETSENAFTQFARKVLSQLKITHSSSFSWLEKMAQSLNLVVTAGSRWPEDLISPPSPGFIRFPSLHFSSPRDPLVPLEDSSRLQLLFQKDGNNLVEHTAGHVFPQNAQAINALTVAMCSMAVRLSEQQHDELSALQSIYPQELVVTRASVPAELEVTLGTTIQVKIRATLPARYPAELPLFSYSFLSNGSRVDNASLFQGLISAVETAYQDLLGCEMLFASFAAAQDWLLDHQSEIEQAAVGTSDDNSAANESAKGRAEQGASPNEEVDEAEMQRMIKDATDEAARIDAQIRGSSDKASSVLFGRGQWDFCIGLVGKPSAGKSTLFNAAIDDARREAKVGAAPFTTIEPNTGLAYCSNPCPCVEIGLNQDRCVDCGGQFGFSQANERLFRVRVKDVAGLVPGAYMGRGRGNAFLNDLLDADCLVHVVDASGKTDRGGNQDESGDPVDDVEWVRLEIHRWIADNISARWHKVRRRPDFIFALFSGYHATESVVAEALRRAGLASTPGALEVSMPTEFGKNAMMSAPLPYPTIHRIVANFLRVRMPIVLALNKCDVDGALHNVERVKEAYPNETITTLSAGREWETLRWRRGGPQVDEAAHQQVQSVGLDGVLGTMNAALRLRGPLLVYPVVDLATCQPLGSEAGRLSQMLIMKTGSTVWEAFEALKYSKLLAGEYVRCEVRLPGGACQVLNKKEGLRGHRVLNVQSTRKSMWQAQLRQHASASPADTP